MRPHVEAEQIVAEQPVEQMLQLRADEHRLARGPGDVPELPDQEIAARLAEHARQEREVEVVDGGVVERIGAQAVVRSPSAVCTGSIPSAVAFVSFTSGSLSPTAIVMGPVSFVRASGAMRLP